MALIKFKIRLNKYKNDKMLMEDEEERDRNYKKN